MDPNSIGLAILGTGRAGMVHAINFCRGIRGCRVVVLADPIVQTLHKAARELHIADAFTDYREALKHPAVDGVVIATPTALHCEIGVSAAKAGKHILCEKPMAMNVEECDAMIAATREAGVILQIGFMRRFSESFVQAKARIEAGEIGQVVQVMTLTHGPSYPKPWMFDLAKSNGPLAEVNSHDIDSVRWFTGSEFQEVYAIAGNYRTAEARAEFPDFYDQVLLSARLADGSQSSISGAQGVQYAYDARCEIIGTHGLISVGSLNGNDVVTCTKDKTIFRASINSWMRLFRDAYLAEDIDFVECIREQRPPRVTGIDGRAAVSVVDAGNLSIREKRPVTLG
jgi:myo-inositol 2-dehydrogenase / D-chiro-inositol 1-dehydrogenase